MFAGEVTWQVVVPREKRDDSVRGGGPEPTQERVEAELQVRVGVGYHPALSDEEKRLADGGA